MGTRSKHRSPSLRLRHGSRALALASTLGLAACQGGAPEGGPEVGTWRGAISLDEAARTTCDTPPELVEGLSRQLVDAINCLRPGTLADIPLNDRIRLLRAGRPAFIDARALSPLLDAAAAGDGDAGPMVIRWAYRDVALQHLFWLQDLYQGCAVAAPAGLSNHQNGLAVDLNGWSEWRPYMQAEGWANDLPNDRVHFDYQLAEDVGLGALSLYAFQALWNKNRPNATIPLSAELDAATDEALGMAPLEGFERDLCEDGVPPVGPGPVRGPTVAQSAWRGCDAPPALVEGLSWQVAQSMNCIQPDALAPLSLCSDPGCLRIQAPPVPEWLATSAHEAILGASEAAGVPITVRWAFRDVALQHFFAKADENIACPGAAPAGQSDHNSGLALNVPDHSTLTGELRAAGFDNRGTALNTIWAYEGPDAEDLTSLNVLAFQRLWNLNRPDDPIDDDGLIGPQTRGAIERSPIAGFPQSLCGEPPVGGAGGGQGGAGGGQGGQGGGAGGAGGQGGQGGQGAQGGGAGAGGSGGQGAGGSGGQGGLLSPDGGISVSRTAPAAHPGWTGQGSAGCQAGPGGDAGWWMLLLGLIGIRRRR